MEHNSTIWILIALGCFANAYLASISQSIKAIVIELRRLNKQP